MGRGGIQKLPIGWLGLEIIVAVSTLCLPQRSLIRDVSVGVIVRYVIILEAA
jgi:hypothetical protein